MKMLFYLLIFPTLILFGLANPNTEHDHLNHPNTVVDRSTGVRLSLVHKDKLATSSSSNNNNHHHLRMRRGARRLARSDFGMDVQYGSTVYYVTLGVGTPPTDQTLLMDTGSDLTWIQCQPCNPCFQQPGPTFDPTKSSSLSWVPCNSDTCNILRNDENLGCNENHIEYCSYKYGYADETYTMGRIASETLTINVTKVPNVPMGCANENNISFDNEADGLLGLGWGSLSLVSQSGGQIGEAFRFCLSSNESNEGWLMFGRSGFPRLATEWAVLIKNPKYPSYYYIEVLRVEVEGKPIDIPGDTFRIDPDTGEGGVIIDTGTTITYLPEVAYNALRDNVKARLDKLFIETPSVDPHYYDTCYRLGSEVELEKTQLPRVSFIFPRFMNSSSIVQIDAANYLVMMDSDLNIACFAFAKSNIMSGIIGNLQLQGIPITIDASAGFIGFGLSNAC